MICLVEDAKCQCFDNSAHQSSLGRIINALTVEMVSTVNVLTFPCGIKLCKVSS